MRFSDLNDGSNRKTADAMRSIMVHNAIHHLGDAPFQSIDAFSASILEDHGLLTATQETLSTAEVVSILSSTHTEGGLATEAGPYIFKKGPDKASMIDPLEILANPESNLRVSAIEYFGRLPTSLLSGRSRRQIEESKVKIGSNNKAEWFPAAKRLYDSLRTDIYLALAGFSQCYNAGFEQGAKSFLKQLLRPDARLLSSIELANLNPTEAYTAAQAVVKDLIARPTLLEAIEEYYLQFGHIPLTGSVGMGELLRGWADCHENENYWEIIWAWADETQSPIARYHACVVFLTNPEFVPNKGEDFLWFEVGDIINLYSKDTTRLRWVDAWGIRNDLAQHFGNYLECLLPGIAGERLMVMAWWLTEKICERLPPSPGLLTKLRNLTIAHELQRSRFMNDLTHPPIAPSSLRYMTRLMPRVWAASVLCELGSTQWLFNLSAPSPDVGRAVDNSLTSLLVLGYPRPVTPSSRPVYAFEKSLGPAASGWAKSTAQQDPIEEEGNLSEALRVAEETSSYSALPILVSDLASKDSGKDVRSANFIRQMVYIDPAVNEDLFDLLSKNSTYLPIFNNASFDALVIFFEALTELQVRHGGKWSLSLAHFFVRSCDETTDPERLDALFRFAVFSSIHAGGVSAVDRLMHGSNRLQFAKMARQLHDHLATSIRVFTPWAAGRIRAILSNLTLDERDMSI